MSTLGEIEQVIEQSIRREELEVAVHHDAAQKHFRAASDLYAEASKAYDPDKGNDPDAGDSFTQQAGAERQAAIAERDKALAEQQKIKGKKESLALIQALWRAGRSIPSPR